MVQVEISNEFLAMVILGTMVGFMIHFLYRTCKDGSWSCDEQEPEDDYNLKDVQIKVFIRKDLISFSQEDENTGAKKSKLSQQDLDECTKRAVYMCFKNSMEFKTVYWKAIHKLWVKNRLKQIYMAVEDENTLHEIILGSQELHLQYIDVFSNVLRNGLNPCGVVIGPATKEHLDAALKLRLKVKNN